MFISCLSISGVLPDMLQNSNGVRRGDSCATLSSDVLRSTLKSAPFRACRDSFQVSILETLGFQSQIAHDHLVQEYYAHELTTLGHQRTQLMQVTRRKCVFTQCVKLDGNFLKSFDAIQGAVALSKEVLAVARTRFRVVGSDLPPRPTNFSTSPGVDVCIDSRLVWERYAHSNYLHHNSLKQNA